MLKSKREHYIYKTKLFSSPSKINLPWGNCWSALSKNGCNSEPQRVLKAVNGSVMGFSLDKKKDDGNGQKCGQCCRPNGPLHWFNKRESAWHLNLWLFNHDAYPYFQKIHTEVHNCLSARGYRKRRNGHVRILNWDKDEKYWCG